ncbi:MAG: hypothetical protein A2Y67_04465 [Candidatus Buchananbacteria bacterium RBG_13_39_9]|uniref:Uncharacterized protein n=1 Tax=Candidatus Buchananbacteria bacterium RBG_13_39_9 TaxID=1797531 RepID=A0A1G1XQF3_9BACT|nr:MAG: hypothetical protein A2Y67_04465 [Candidatus Buchananbacteria bacterium RBG_13_39_9]
MLAVFFEEKFVGDFHAGEESYECLGVYFSETKTVIKINQTHTRLAKLDDKGVGVYESLIQAKKIQEGFLASEIKLKLISMETLPENHPLLGMAAKIAELDLEREKLDQKYKELRENHLEFFPTSKK